MGVGPCSLGRGGVWLLEREVCLPLGVSFVQVWGFALMAMLETGSLGGVLL